MRSKIYRLVNKTAAHGFIFIFVQKQTKLDNCYERRAMLGLVYFGGNNCLWLDRRINQSIFQQAPSLNEQAHTPVLIIRRE